jgi:hypothetical protein
MNETDWTQLKIAAMAIASQQPPDWQRPLMSYFKFDWEQIGAKVYRSDGHGATLVSWMGHVYTRRSGGGKFGRAIWFSRAVRSEGEEAIYGRLITFKDFASPEPLHAEITAIAPPRARGLAPAGAAKPLLEPLLGTP